MRVRECRKCRFFRERRWSQYYEPKNYHAIGFTHKYGYCALMKQRCTEVKTIDCTPNQMTIFDMEGKNENPCSL